eukprot:CAMPEP_0118915278 /NCGR_PEP_ID=MMETSP1166-20130328/15462_1 /TAXON_ID=1104430 /ORGANISM="Chrysoreinhardia sp, Strain CCMP3193" /LENGTH=117 /DNA_ID=CAMNT_0006854941 /DNA_START=168 /DNA_END=518 /DNA_ORIENTATION=-
MEEEAQDPQNAVAMELAVVREQPDRDSDSSSAGSSDASTAAEVNWKYRVKFGLATSAVLMALAGFLVLAEIKDFNDAWQREHRELANGEEWLCPKPPHPVSPKSFEQKCGPQSDKGR